MISLPDFNRSFDYENNFYLSCAPQRIGKAIAHYELFKMAARVSGAVVECGVFKGASFSRFAMFLKLFGSGPEKKLIGFDTFGKFPETGFADDRRPRKKFIGSAGDQSISCSQMLRVLKHKGLTKNIELIKGNILETVPAYVKKHKHLRISLLNLDTDVYEPAVTILEYLYPRLAKGGVLVLDDYRAFPGETKAVVDYFKGKRAEIRRFAYTPSPYFMVKTR